MNAKLFYSGVYENDMFNFRKNGRHIRTSKIVAWPHLYKDCTEIECFLLSTMSAYCCKYVDMCNQSEDLNLNHANEYDSPTIKSR